MSGDSAAHREVRSRFRSAFRDVDLTDLTALRAADHAYFAPLNPSRPQARRTTIAGVDVLVEDPAGAISGAVLLWVHGGAFVAGSAADRLHLAATVAAPVGARVVLPDYRLAPEHPFPGAVDDVGAVLQRLLEHHGPDRVVLAGDSSGAGVAVAASLAAARSGLPQPAGLVLLSPYVDLTLSGASLGTNATRDRFLHAAALRHGTDAYLAGHPATDALASPLLGDHAATPETLLMVGADEILLDDARRLHEVLGAAGVRSHLDVVDDVFHVWPVAFPVLPAGAAAVRRITRFVADRLAVGTA